MNAPVRAAARLVDRIQRLGEADLDLWDLRVAVDRLLREAIGYDVAAVSTVDPATMLWTSCFVSGLDAEGGPERERILLDIEFRGDDPNGYVTVAAADVPAARLHAATGGDLRQAQRYGRLLAGFGVVDEMRVALRSRELCWGFLTLYRTGDRPVFTPADEALAAAASTPVADLFRLTLLRAALGAPHAVEQPPGLLLVSPEGDVAVTTEAAQAWLSVLDDRDRIPSAVRSVAAAAAAGRGLARAAVPAPDGRWVVLHGSAVTRSSGGAPLQVAVIVEGARPAVVSEVIAEAYGFTPREREITGLAARGRTTKQMAAALGLSPFTVQDHLKAVFAKAGVQNRGELVAAIYVQQYEPRTAAGATPGPYGWYLDDTVSRPA